MNGPFGGVVASLIGEAQESDATRAIVSALIAPYRELVAADHFLGAILFRRLLGPRSDFGRSPLECGGASHRFQIAGMSTLLNP